MFIFKTVKRIHALMIRRENLKRLYCEFFASVYEVSLGGSSLIFLSCLKKNYSSGTKFMSSFVVSDIIRDIIQEKLRVHVLKLNFWLFDTEKSSPL